MESTSELVEQIRTALAATDTLSKDQLLQLATSFVRACQAVNQKAQRCRDLLRDGMRDEASQLAAEAPTLQDEALALDFVERLAWVEFCEAAGLEIRQHDLNADTVNRVLKSLSTDARKLEALLRLHRRLALGRAPLGQRVRVLRQIARADTERTFWQEDLKTFEAARREELQAVATQAARAGDLDAMDAILTELRSQDWLVPPPPTVVSAIERLFAPFIQRRADNQFTNLTEQLHEAHGTQNEPAARQLLAQWQGLIQSTGVDPPPALIDQVGAVESWLNDLDAMRAEEAAFEDACRTLREALNENKGRRALEALAADILRSGRPMPDLLAARLNARLAELQKASRRKFVLMMVAIAGTVVLIAAGVAAFSYWQQQLAVQKRFLAQLQQAKQQGNSEEIAAILSQIEKQNPDFYRDPRVQSHRIEHQQAVAARERDQQTFDTTMAQLKDAGVENSDPVLVARAEDAANRLGDAEKAQIRAWNEAVAARKQAEKDKVQQAFDSMLARLEILKEKTDAALAQNSDDAVKLARECIVLAERLAERTDVADQGPSRAKDIGQEVRQLLAGAKDNARRKEDLDRRLARLPSLYNRPQRLAEELNKFAQECGDLPRGAALARDFLQAAPMAPLWQAADAWDQVARRWGIDPRVNDPQIAARRLEAVEKHLADFAESPHRLIAERYRDYLKAATEAITDAGLKGLAATERRLTNRLYTDTYVLHAIDPSTRKPLVYYTYLPTLAENRYGDTIKSYTMAYIADGTGTIRKAYIKPQDMKSKLAKAPQNAFVTKALSWIQKFRGREWETFYLRLAQLVQTHPDIDPILRAKFLNTFLTNAVPCAPFRVQRIENAAKILEDLEFDVAWMHPADSDVARARAAAARALKRIPAIDAIALNIEKDIEALRSPLRPYEAIGILMGEDRAVKPASTTREGHLSVLDRRAGLTFRKTGTATKGKPPTIDQRVASRYPQGTIVYIKTR